MADVKMTHSIALNYVLENCEIPSDVVEDLSRLLASINHKNASGSRGLTKTQKENVDIKAQIVAEMEIGTGYTATQVGNLVGISMNKAAALLNQLVKAGDVVKSTEGKSTIFRVAAE